MMVCRGIVHQPCIAAVLRVPNLMFVILWISRLARIPPELPHRRRIVSLRAVLVPMRAPTMPSCLAGRAR